MTGNTVPPGSDTKFYLFTRKNKETGIEISNNTEILNKTKEFRYITHGYLEDSFREHYIKLKNTFLQRDDFNVVLVDWRKSATNLYSKAVQNTRAVGEGKKIHKMNTSNGEINEIFRESNS